MYLNVIIPQNALIMDATANALKNLSYAFPTATIACSISRSLEFVRSSNIKRLTK